ncbi:Hypothetical predicted protein [Lynx pardinus]|uniref:Uncharacterized protein n=1 Tax=Lynx pardinus TaxID=191816 RepID=A0A485PEP8_LYNPA|nr:Hypothetical predicted protein [Lynx pardinus]
MALAKKGVQNKNGRSAINEVVTTEYNNIHKRIHGFQEVCPSDTQRDPEICHEGDGNSKSVH